MNNHQHHQNSVPAENNQENAAGVQQASSGASVFAVDTQHSDNINDCQWNFYGTQIASVDSRGFLQISALKNGVSQQVQTFQAHNSPIWQCAWAHPKFEEVIATCGFDQCVKVWKRDQNNNWENAVFERKFNSSVNCLAWAPWEYGLVLAVGLAEGTIVVLRNEGGVWNEISNFMAHAEGVNGLAWGPATEPALLCPNSTQLSSQQSARFQPPPKRLVSGGNDRMVNLWILKDGQTPEQQSIGQHDDWVRDVDWSGNIGMRHEMIASCSEDGVCSVWKNSGPDNSWQCNKIRFGAEKPLWKVSFSQVGNMLAISGGENQVHIMSEQPNGDWTQVQLVNEESSQEGISKVDSQ